MHMVSLIHTYIPTYIRRLGCTNSAHTRTSGGWPIPTRPTIFQSASIEPQDNILGAQVKPESTGQRLKSTQVNTPSAEVNAPWAHVNPQGPSQAKVNTPRAQVNPPTAQINPKSPLSTFFGAVACATRPDTALFFYNSITKYVDSSKQCYY